MDISGKLLATTPAISTILADGFVEGGFLYNKISFIRRNRDKIRKPFEFHGYSAHFVFSYGHLLMNAGYDRDVNYLFFWEEPYQRYLTWKAGYTIYCPSKFLLWHN